MPPVLGYQAARAAYGLGECNCGRPCKLVQSRKENGNRDRLLSLSELPVSAHVAHGLIRAIQIPEVKWRTLLDPPIIIIHACLCRHPD